MSRKCFITKEREYPKQMQNYIAPNCSKIVTKYKTEPIFFEQDKSMAEIVLINFQMSSKNLKGDFPAKLITLKNIYYNNVNLFDIVSIMNESK